MLVHCIAYKKPGWVNNFHLKIVGEEIGRMENVECFLILDRKLTRKQNCLLVQSKLGKLNYLFYHSKNYFIPKHLKALYIVHYMNQL